MREFEWKFSDDEIGPTCKEARGCSQKPTRRAASTNRSQRAVKRVVVWHDVITCGVFERCGIFREASIGACRDRHLSEAKLVEGTTDKPSSCARWRKGGHCAFAMNEAALL